MRNSSAGRTPGISSWDYVHWKMWPDDVARMEWLNAHKHEDDTDEVRALERKQQKEAKR